MTEKTVKLTDFTPDPRNANKGTQRGRGLLENSLQKLGAGRSVLADKHGVLIAGNKTLQTAVESGFENAIVVETDGTQLVVVKRTDLDLSTDAKAKELAIADNRVGEISLEWDASVLAELSEEIDLSGMFFEDELKDLLEGLENNLTPAIDPEEDEANTADLIEKVESGEIVSRVKPGDIFALGRHRICCGDSTVEANVRKLLGDRFNDVGMVWADPPFNTKQQQGRTSSDWGIIENDNMSDAEFNVFVSKLFKVFALFPDSPLYVCCHWKSYPVFFSSKSKMNALIVWVKNNFGLGSGYRPQHEFICFWGHLESSSESNVWQIARDAAATYKHPMQKPVELLEKALSNSSKPNDLIFDPFLGSAPSIIAAQKMEGDRAVYGFELSEAYCEIICQRFEALTGKVAELVGTL